MNWEKEIDRARLLYYAIARVRTADSFKWIYWCASHASRATQCDVQLTSWVTWVAWLVAASGLGRRALVGERNILRADFIFLKIESRLIRSEWRHICTCKILKVLMLFINRTSKINKMYQFFIFLNFYLLHTNLNASLCTLESGFFLEKVFFID